MNKVNIHRPIAVSLLLFGAALITFIFPHTTAQSLGPGRILTTGVFGVLAFNTDASVGINLTGDAGTNYSGVATEGPGGGSFTNLHPSAAQNGLIAFMSDRDGTGNRIYLMNSDGSGMRQLTSTAGAEKSGGGFFDDAFPAISPDGTHVFFISKRNPPAQSGPVNNIFVVNADGSGSIRQVTFTTHFDVHGNAQDSSDVVVCNPADNTKLAFRGSRLGLLVLGIITLNADGTAAAEQILAQLPSTGLSTSLDWSPNGRYIVVGFGGEAAGSGPNRMILFDLQANTSGDIPNTSNIAPLSPGQIRFSPDSQRLAFTVGNPSLITFINIDGTNFTQLSSPRLPFSVPIWWQPGAAIPAPARLDLSPNSTQIFIGGLPLDIAPTLFDGQGNVIVRAASAWTSGGNMNAVAKEIGSQRVTISANINDQANRTTNLCGSNGGITACSTIQVLPLLLSVSTSTPTIRKSGADGPGLLNLKLNAAAPALTVFFALSGSATRGTDYLLTDAAGNVITGNTTGMAAGQTSLNLKIVPLVSSSSGDQSVTFKVLSDNATLTYSADPTADTANITIKDDHPLPPLQLLTLTPTKGGDGGSVTVTVYGQGIQTGASVKLARTGQTDIVGTSISVGAGGTSIRATFDLTGKAQGAWDVVVSNPDGTMAMLPAAFTIEAIRPAQLWVDLVGRYTFRSGFTQPFYVAYGNRGNVDSLPTIIRLAIPNGLTVSSLPQIEGGDRPVVSSEDGQTVLQFYVPTVAANSTTFAAMQLTASPTILHTTQELQMWGISHPTLQAPFDPTVTMTPGTITENTDTSFIGTVHLSSALVEGEIDVEVSLTAAPGPADPTFSITSDGVTVEAVAQIVVANDSVSGNTFTASANQPMQGGFTNVKNKVKTGQKIWDLIKKGKGALSAGELNQTRKGLADCFFSHDTPEDKSCHDQLNTLADGASTYSFVNFALSGFGLFKSAPKPVSAFNSVAEQLGNGQWGQLFANCLKTSGLQDNRISNLVFPDGPQTPNSEIFQHVVANMDKLCPPCKAVQSSRQSLPAVGLQLTPDDCSPCPGGSCPGPDNHHITLEIVVAGDPNEKDGSQGSGGTQRFVSGLEPLRYVISFENKPDATAPAQTVVVTDQLDTSNLDLSSFTFGGASFGNTVVSLPAGLSNSSTDVDLRPSNNLIVRINAQLDNGTGLLTWRFTSIDPATGQPTTDPLAGFLPPDKNPPEGQGSVSFSVMPKAGLATGTEIRNKSRITFDVNAPIDTNEYLNTIDNTNPMSHVNALDAAQPFVIFNVSWSGTDVGSGVRDYTVYFSENGGAYSIWLAHTTQTSAFFIGRPQTTYSFFTVATDNANNQEAIKTTAEATTSTPSNILNSIDDARFFVYQHYADFLNRYPDQSGWDYWTSQITQCGSDATCIHNKRVDVSNAFFFELEYQQTAAYAFRLYRAAYGNNQPFPNPDTSNPAEANKLPSYAAFARDRAQVVGGADLSSGQQALANAFAQRTAFTNKYSANLTLDQFVDAVLGTIQAADSVDLSSQRTALIALGSRGAVLYRLANDDLAGGNGGINNRAFIDAEYDRAFVYSQYAGYLHRDADIGGFLFWLGQVNSAPLRDTTKQHAMVCSFITSAEYQQRFGSIVTHTNAECPQ